LKPQIRYIIVASCKKEGGFDHVIAKAAADRGIALEFDVGPLIRYRGGKRVHAISELEQRLMLARKI
jgi:ribonuclease P/MRP protein subunit RPP1